MSGIRVLTAAALFDGHDVSINLFRRLLQARGAEVIHLGHNRSVREVVTVAVQEDVDALLVSSYQGGHNEYFRFVVDSRRRWGVEKDMLVFGGGGGVILPSEIEALETYGVARLYHAVDGQKLGLTGIADDIMARIRQHQAKRAWLEPADLPEAVVEQNDPDNHLQISRQLSLFERLADRPAELETLREVYRRCDRGRTLVLGVTGTGGSGKSSVIDELVGRFLGATDGLRLGILAVDPTKSTTGGALLGDRIRYNQIYHPRVFFRSFATRHSHNELSAAIRDAIAVLRSCGFDLVFVETSGIGQGDSGVTAVSDRSMYVMTAEFGAPSQLEKIDMLDLADFKVINKFEKRGAEDALREVLIHHIRSRQLKVPRTVPLEQLDLPVYATSSNQFNNHGLNRLFRDLLKLLQAERGGAFGLRPERLELLPTQLERDYGLLDNRRTNYLAEIAETVRDYHRRVAAESQAAGEAFALRESQALLEEGPARDAVREKYQARWAALTPETRDLITGWDRIREEYQVEEIHYRIQGREVVIPLHYKSLSGSRVPKVALPRCQSWRELVQFLYKEQLPGYFPYTAGVFPFKRVTEDPKRQFAGEGGPERTNRRFHYLCQNDAAKRRSVACDGGTLYGEDPAADPDIYGKVGESGVSVCTIEDMEALLAGFDQLDPLTSVSMTINAPAPIMVAFYFMVAWRRELDRLAAAGVSPSEEEKAALRVETFRRLRGTVQADMLKEDQGQNTCIFSIDFALRLIGDLQEYLSRNRIRNYYSLSISGYHIAEAGANPVTQLAFTLANGFTYVEYFLKRGLAVDDFAPNLSFFFSNGMDPEYSVIGRVARRIWAVAMKHRYGANDSSQKLKYHIQTSGRSLHAQDLDFNDIRTTLQGLLAFYDNCNSLHTNSYDEAVTTPTEESVRRSMAIQMILAKEFGLLKNENPNQGAFIIEELTDLVEEAVLQEFERLSRRGGVLGAMETQYQRSRIQEQSLYYETLKQSGEYPLVGVNTFVSEHPDNPYDRMTITRSTEEEKAGRLEHLRRFQSARADGAGPALERLRQVALGGGNIFEELLQTVEHASMGQVTRLLYEIGGRYRRGM